MKPFEEQSRAERLAWMVAANLEADSIPIEAVLKLARGLVREIEAEQARREARAAAKVIDLATWRSR